MPAYTRVDSVVQRLNTTIEKFRELESFGWISIVEKNGVLYVPGHHEYKAKFILHLQQVRNLNAQQISRVLFIEQPPYSLKEVDRILAAEPPANPTTPEEFAHGKSC